MFVTIIDSNLIQIETKYCLYEILRKMHFISWRARASHMHATQHEMISRSRTSRTLSHSLRSHQKVKYRTTNNHNTAPSSSPLFSWPFSPIIISAVVVSTFVLVVVCRHLRLQNIGKSFGNLSCAAVCRAATQISHIITPIRPPLLESAP